MYTMLMTPINITILISKKQGKKRLDNDLGVSLSFFSFVFSFTPVFQTLPREWHTVHHLSSPQPANATFSFCFRAWAETTSFTKVRSHCAPSFQKFNVFPAWAWPPQELEKNPTLILSSDAIFTQFTQSPAALRMSPLWCNKGHDNSVTALPS